MDKAARQKILLNVVRAQKPANQHQIVSLMKRAGWKVTQASVSRDVHELGLVKANGHYALLNDLPPAPAAAVTDAAFRVRGLLVSARAVGSHLVVVRTAVAAASTVATAMDQQLTRDAVGTLAGDDTIFVAVQSRAAQTRVLQTLRAWGAARE